MIEQEIVLITYAGLIGAIALGSALAFGLGGREAAARALDTAVDKGKEQQGQAKRDLEEGRSESRDLADKAKGGGSNGRSDGGNTTDPLERQPGDVTRPSTARSPRNRQL